MTQTGERIEGHCIHTHTHIHTEALKTDRERERDGKEEDNERTKGKESSWSCHTSSEAFISGSTASWWFHLDNFLCKESVILIAGVSNWMVRDARRALWCIFVVWWDFLWNLVSERETGKGWNGKRLKQKTPRWTLCDFSPVASDAAAVFFAGSQVARFCQNQNHFCWYFPDNWK